MTKYFILLLIAVSVFVSPGSSSKSAAGQNRSAVVGPTPAAFAEIEKIEFDKDEVMGSCLPCKPRTPPWDDSGQVTVKTIVKNLEKVALSYIYTVSGGRIIGKGESVTWDLNGVDPGFYVVTA